MSNHSKWFSKFDGMAICGWTVHVWYDFTRAEMMATFARDEDKNGEVVKIRHTEPFGVRGKQIVGQYTCDGYPVYEDRHKCEEEVDMDFYRMLDYANRRHLLWRKE